MHHVKTSLYISASLLETLLKAKCDSTDVWNSNCLTNWCGTSSYKTMWSCSQTPWCTKTNAIILYIRMVFFTYPTNVLIMRVEFVEELAVKGPRKRHIQRGITCDLAWQDDTLAHYDLHIHWALRDPCWIWAKYPTQHHITICCYLSITWRSIMITEWSTLF